MDMGDAQSGLGLDDVVRDLRRGLGSEPHAGRHRGGSPRGRGRRPVRRRVAVALVLALVAAVAGAVTVVAVRGGAPSSASADVAGSAASASALVSGSPEPGAATWTEVVDRLDRARAAALTTANVGALQAADAPGSVAEREDRRAALRLRRLGLRPVGLRFDVRAVQVVSSSATRVRLRVVDRRSAYALLDRSAVERARLPARPERVWRVDLLLTDGAWRFAAARAGV